MTKHELIDEVADRAVLSRARAADAVEALLAAVHDELAAGGEVAITGFGRFHSARRGGRAGADPRTGAPIAVPDVVVPRFTPSSTLKRAVRA